MWATSASEAADLRRARSAECRAPGRNKPQGHDVNSQATRNDIAIGEAEMLAERDRRLHPAVGEVEIGGVSANRAVCSSRKFGCDSTIPLLWSHCVGGHRRRAARRKAAARGNGIALAGPVLAGRSTRAFGGYAHSLLAASERGQTQPSRWGPAGHDRAALPHRTANSRPRGPLGWGARLHRSSSVHRVPWAHATGEKPLQER